MARKKKNKRGGRCKASQRSGAHLAKSAAEHLQAERFKDAIEDYKQLLKLEQNPQWQGALAQAYFGRAKGLADKGMYKEAVALWENMAHSCASQQGMGLYLQWLVRGGRYQRALHWYVEADPELRKDKQMQSVAGLFGGMLLTGHNALIEQALCSDEPMQRDLQPLRAALRAYCEDQPQEAADCLRQIPFRSPFRDLRKIMQAMGQIASDADGTRELLAKIPADSAYARFARVVALATGPVEPLMAALTNLQAAEIELIATLRGLSKEQTAMLNGVQQLFSASHSKAKGKNFSSNSSFQFVMDHRVALGEEVAERFCRRMLPFYNNGIKAYTDGFGPLSKSERYRITALHFEQSRDNMQGDEYWELCVNELLQGSGAKNNKLAAATIIRHTVDQYGHPADPDVEYDSSINILQNSLELDPLDKPTYLNLLQRLKADRHRKEHDRCLELAVKHLPTDSDILLAAASAAHNRGAHNKAARFVMAVIERDPINSKARQLLIDCQLAQLRKHILSGKIKLAQKGLLKVQSYVRTEQQAALLSLHHGFFVLSGGDKDGAQTHFTSAFDKDGIRLLMVFILLIEGQYCGFSLQELQPYTLTADGLDDISKEKILTLMGLLQHYLSMQYGPALDEVLRLFHKPIKAAVVRDFGEQDLQLICDVFAQIGDYNLLKTYSSTALKRFDRPMFVYFQVLANCKGIKRLSHRDFDRLIDAQYDADMDHDFGIGARIERLIVDLGPDFSEDEQTIQQVVDQLGVPNNVEEIEEFAGLFGLDNTEEKPHKRREAEDKDSDIPVQGELF